MVQCPGCDVQIDQDFGMVTCDDCHAVFMIDYSGKVIFENPQDVSADSQNSSSSTSEDSVSTAGEDSSYNPIANSDHYVGEGNPQSSLNIENDQTPDEVSNQWEPQNPIEITGLSESEEVQEYREDHSVSLDHGSPQNFANIEGSTENSNSFDTDFETPDPVDPIAGETSFVNFGEDETFSDPEYEDATDNESDEGFLSAEEPLDTSTLGSHEDVADFEFEEPGTRVDQIFEDLKADKELMESLEAPIESSVNESHDDQFFVPPPPETVQKPPPPPPVKSPVSKPIDITDFAAQSSSSVELGALIYFLKISGIDSRDLYEVVDYTLSDSRIGLPHKKLMSQVKGGVLVLEELPPLKVKRIVEQLQYYDLQMTWTQGHRNRAKNEKPA